MERTLRITTMPDDNLLSDLRSKFDWLEPRGHTLFVSKPSSEDQTWIIDLKMTGDSHLKSEDVLLIFNRQVSDIIATHILKVWEERFVQREVVKKTRQVNKSEHPDLIHNSLTFLRECNSSEALNLLMNFGRRNKLSHKVLDYIQGHDDIVIEGFLQFGMQGYLDEIRFAVDLACEELDHKKEYLDFVKLLKYFVDSQPGKIDEVHISKEEDGYLARDGKGNNLVTDESCFIDGNDPEADDMLTSILISYRPKRVILHNFLTNDMVDVIRDVFADRIEDSQSPLPEKIKSEEVETMASPCLSLVK